MFNLFLILLGLFSNPSHTNTSNCGNNGDDPTIVNPNPTPGDTGGDEGHPKPPKIIGG
ncbi:hypothetical protein [Epilithonimonas sp. UC225_85]|uniref:hypothetical protein n=1 Tax=Epilithonimonas sp. UC225_85 TaxID=3350167 RepID=UPI0036D37101